MCDGVSVLAGGWSLVATVQRRCPGKPGKPCGTRFRVQSQNPRKFCESCSPPRFRSDRIDPPPSIPDEYLPGPIERSVLAELEAVDRAGAVKGQIALGVARDCDRLAGLPQRSAVAERLVKLVADAMAGTKATTDRLDEVAARRAEKAAAAS